VKYRRKKKRQKTKAEQERTRIRLKGNASDGLVRDNTGNQEIRAPKKKVKEKNAEAQKTKG